MHILCPLNNFNDFRDSSKMKNNYFHSSFPKVVCFKSFSMDVVGFSYLCESGASKTFLKEIPKNKYYS